MSCCPLLDIFRKCACCEGTICLFCGRLTLVVIAILLGTIVAWKPKKIIKAQMAAYRPFNWKLEPISMEKEIRNTRVMGLILLVLGLLSLVYVLLF